MKTSFNIDACFFPGFYESILESSDMVANEIDQFITDIHDNHPKFEIDEDDDVEVDYKAYENAIANAWARAYATYFPEGMVKSWEFDSIVPPRNTGYGPDYRYGTDKLYLNVELADDWMERMKKFISDNQEWFEKRIGDDWSSYDGFFSYMENNLTGWLKGLEDEDERYISTTLAYMMMKENDEFWDDVNMSAFEDVSMYPYINLSEEKAKEFEEFKEAEAEERRIKEYDEKHQLKLDFPQDGQ
jgi:hypothetical protein